MNYTLGGKRHRRRTKKYRKNHRVVKPTNKHPMRVPTNLNCSPVARRSRVSDASCYPPDALEKIKHAYNMGHGKEDQIVATDPLAILNNLRSRLVQCKKEDCWLREIKDPTLRKNLDEMVFAPDQPENWKKNPNEWLSNYDILHVLRQYEKAYRNFKLIGPTPIDFDARPEKDSPQCVWQDLCGISLETLYKAGKRKIGVVFNLDKHDEPGSHWTSLFIDMDEAVLFYFDSAANRTPSEVKVLVERLKYQGKTMTPSISFRYVENFPKMHQRSNTECGMYSLFFIITMLTGGENRGASASVGAGAGQGAGANASVGSSVGSSANASANAGPNELPKELTDLHGGIQQGMSMDQRIELFTKKRIPDKFVEAFRYTYYNT